MASNVECSIHSASDLIYEFSCFTCQDNERNTEAEFYCEECSKFFCGKCVELHKTLFKKHATLGKENISQWPQTNVDAQEQCQEHKKEKLTAFCEDHSELICHVCHVYTHKKCSHVVLIADKVEDLHQRGDFKQLSAKVDILLQQMTQKTNDFEESKKCLKKSYNKIVEEINILRKQINDSLDQLKKNTINELDTLLGTMGTSIQTDIEHCTKSIKSMKCVHEDWQRRKDKSEALNFNMYAKCLNQFLKVEAVLQEMATKHERTLKFNPDTTIQKTLSTFSGLGQIMSIVKISLPAKSTTQNTVTRQNKPKSSSQSDPTTTGLNVKKSYPESSPSRQSSPAKQSSDLIKSDQVSDPVSCSSQQMVKEYQPGAVSKPDPIIKVKSSKKYNVLIKGETLPAQCDITGICETASGELLIIDNMNLKVKLLDKTYKVVAHFNLSNPPHFMCSIDSNLVAISLYECEVHFIRVVNYQLKMERMLKFIHECRSIAQHQDNLYIASSTVLYQYTVDGSLISKMYEDTSGVCTVASCAVSPEGDRIYVSNCDRNQLVTLSKDGTVISTLTDPAWSKSISRIHVTHSGQVLVCGGACSNTILQVDRDGRRRLARVVTGKDGVSVPISAHYSKLTGTLIVGMLNNDYIMVFQTQ